MNTSALSLSPLLTASSSALLEDVVASLTDVHKSIHPKWLYDQAGSALFEQITALPEYYLTRTETALLRAHADSLAALVPADGALVEFGSGASVKTRLLLDAGPHIGTYVPIDISADFLQDTACGLRLRYPSLQVVPVVGDFLNPVALPDALVRVPKTGFFPGSTLGNITPEAAHTLLARARGWPGIGAFVLGVDLVKDPDTLIDAYDDSAGVTAKFITNILVRLNTELGTNFDVSQFSYEATWNAGKARIEMALVSTRAQTAMMQGHTISFQAGEKIAISMSRKYTRDSIRDLAERSGWTISDWITDPNNLFAVTVLRPC